MEDIEKKILADRERVDSAAQPGSLIDDEYGLNEFRIFSELSAMCEFMDDSFLENSFSSIVEANSRIRELCNIPSFNKAATLREIKLLLADIMLHINSMAMQYGETLNDFKFAYNDYMIDHNLKDRCNLQSPSKYLDYGKDDHRLV